MAEHAPQFGRPEIDHREIARLNDWMRDNLTNPGHNRVVMTVGIAALIGDVARFSGFRRRAELLRTIRDFDADNDPHGNRDLGQFSFERTPCLWKIDYYSHDLSAGSENLADPFQTVRVLTILRADEW